MRRLVYLAVLALGTAHAFDTAPHRVGDGLGTAAAQALLARYEARPKQPWREPDEARIRAGPRVRRSATASICCATPRAASASSRRMRPSA